MSLIEGIGDEVLVAFAVAIVIILVVIAWVSTQVGDINFVTVHIFRPAQPETRQQSEPTATPSSQTVDANTSQTPDDALTPGNEVAEPQEGNLSSDHTNESSLSGSESAQANEAETDNPPNQTESTAVASVENHSENAAPTNTQPSTHLPPNELRKRRIEFLSDHLNSAANVTASPVTEVQPVNEVQPVIEVQPDVQPDVQNEETLNEPRTAESVSSQPEEFVLLEGHIRLRLKDLADTERVVQVKPEDTISHFKRTHFAAELANNKVVRLICNGRELSREDLTIRGYNLTDNCILHCLVRQNVQPTSPLPHLELEEDWEVGMYMIPLFAIVLGLVWYCRIVYREFFDPMATFSLIGMTLVFGVVSVASWFHRDREQLQVPAHLHVE